MSFAIIISEKGGQERREVFDKNEISIGRVQGNDLLLPKGNVSKRHARIVYRDGRFIVTDLKSTNGSYVNGHRIAQATIVREGDKIYIGDFILRVDGSGSATSPAPSSRESEAPSESPPSAAPRQQTFSQNEGSAIAHIPLEYDPDDNSMTGLPAIYPGQGQSRPPPVRSSQTFVAAAPMPQVAERVSPKPLVPAASPVVPVIPPRIPLPPAPPPSGGSGSNSKVPIREPVVPPAPRIVDAPRVEARVEARVESRTEAPRAQSHGPRDSDPSRHQRPGYAPAVTTLLQRLSDVVDMDEGDVIAPPTDTRRATVERVLREQIRAMAQEAELPGSPDELVRDALREALGAGPLEAMLDDEDVVEVQAMRFDQLLVVREGGQPAPLDLGFSSEAALRRAIARLALSAGHTLREGESTLDVRLPRGAHLGAIFPPVAAHGTIVTLRKQHRADQSLEDFVRQGTLSRPMVAFLQQCIAAKANILVTGPLGSATTPILGALASAASLEERILAVQEVDELVLSQPYGASLLVPDVGEGGGRTVRMAASLRPDRLLIAVTSSAILGQTVEAIAGGLEGVIAVAHGPTLAQSLSRLVPALVAARPGIDPTTARIWIGASFDVVIELTAPRQGIFRVARICEIAGTDAEIKTRDVFEHIIDTNGEAFQACGVVPGLVTRLKARGQKVDEGIFRRGAR